MKNNKLKMINSLKNTKGESKTFLDLIVFINYNHYSGEYYQMKVLIIIRYEFLTTICIRISAILLIIT